LRFVKISEKFFPPSKIFKLSLANPYSDVVPLHQQEQSIAYPQPLPKGGELYPFGG
jgi:hypothetical protein